MRVDSHTHFLPETFRALLRDWGYRVRIDGTGDDARLHHSHGTLPLRDGFTDIETRKRWMRRHDIDRTLVSVSTPNPNEGPFSVDESTELIEAINEGYAAVRAAHPETITPLGMLPLRDPEAAVAELDRIADDFDFPGVALPTTVRGQKLSHPELKPVFDRLDALDLPAFVHPKPNAISDALNEGEWFANPLAIFPSETTIQICRLIFDGFFDEHEFDVLIAHLGGTLPYLAGRMERGRSLFTGEDQSPNRPIEAYLEEFYYDLISFHPPAIRAAVETVGAERLLFGTDYPFGIEDANAVIDSVEAAVPSESRQQVLGETATDLFDL